MRVAERVYEAAMHMLAVRGLSYVAPEEINKCINIAIAGERAIFARIEEIEALDEELDPRRPRAPKPAPTPVPDPEADTLDFQARKMFDAYNAEPPNPGKTFDGRAVPPWNVLGPQVRGKWCAAAQAAFPGKILRRMPEPVAAPPVAAVSPAAPAPAQAGPAVPEPGPTAPAVSTTKPAPADATPLAHTAPASSTPT